MKAREVIAGGSVQPLNADAFRDWMERGFSGLPVDEIGGRYGRTLSVSSNLVTTAESLADGMGYVKLCVGSYQTQGLCRVVAQHDRDVPESERYMLFLLNDGGGVKREEKRLGDLLSAARYAGSTEYRVESGRRDGLS